MVVQIIVSTWVIGKRFNRPVNKANEVQQNNIKYNIVVLHLHLLFYTANN